MVEIAAPTISFAGLVGIESANFILSRGTEPSRGMVTSAVIDQVPDQVSDFEVTYDGETLTLTDCAIVECYVDSTDFGQTLRVVFMDRRWQWSMKEITGRYNVKDENNTLKYAKTPQELASLLLDAMGETGYDVSDLPNSARPYVDWRNSPCDSELAALLSLFDCDIVPDLVSGGVKVVKLGTGAALPTNPYLMNPSETIAYPIVPEKIQVVTANARYQVLFELEAVGLEPNGDIVPIDDLSYTPSDGWEYENADFFEGVTDTYIEEGTGYERDYRDLALASVFRWYRIKFVVSDGYAGIYDEGGPLETEFAPGDAFLNPPGFEEAQASGAPDLTDIDQLLPLLPFLNETYLTETFQEKPKPMRLYGQWYDFEFTTDDDNVPMGTEWKYGFNVDLERGIVQLPRAVTKFAEPSPGDIRFGQATFLLLAACEADWVGLNRKVYYGENRVRSGVVSPELTVTDTRLDVIPKYTAVYDEEGVDDLPVCTGVTKDEEIYTQIGYYLDELEARIAARSGATAEYADLRIIGPDGAIEQVEWDFGPWGTTTRVARFTRLNNYARSYAEVKRDAEINRALELWKRDARVQGRA